MYEAARHVRHYHRTAVQAAGKQAAVLQQLHREVKRLKAANSSTPGVLRAVFAEPVHMGLVYISNREELFQWCR
jgi:hypothetical protein